MKVNGYEIKFNPLFKKWQVTKEDCCQADFEGTYSGLKEAILYAENG